MTLKLVPSFKYLGVVLDPTLSYGQHINAVISTVQHKIYLLGKVKRYLNNEVATQIYKSMILPYLDYADVVFCKANTTGLEKLQRLQNRGLRLCLGHDRRYNTVRAHKEAKTPFLRERRRAHTLNFMHARKTKKTNLLNKREIRTRAHDAPLFNLAIPMSEAFKRSVGYHGSEEWNRLAPEVRNIESYLEFKGEQKETMLTSLQLLNQNLLTQ